MVTLEVFVEADCWSCVESRRIVEEIAPQFPQVAIELIDLSTQSRPIDVFAVPTYMLNGEIISLGNPYPKELQQKIEDALNGV
jgi:hypothetical protein